MEDKIPVEKVIDDMFNPDSGMVSVAARDYYYNNYATEEEKKIMDNEDQALTILAIAIIIALLGLVFIGTFNLFIL